METLPIPLIKSQKDAKLYKDCVKIISRRNPTLEKSDFYEFQKFLFEK